MMSALATAADTNARLTAADTQRGRVLWLGLFIATLGVAAFLRFWGIRWGLPNVQRLGSYHPDEAVNLFSGVLLNGVARPHLDIGFYNYGSFYFLLWQVGIAVNSTYGFTRPPATPGSNPAESIAAMVLTGRILTALAGTLTCAVLLGASRLFERRVVGAAAAACYAVAPIAVVHGHFATVDGTATMLVAAVMVVALVLVRQPRVMYASWAGLLAGLAGATRYNAILCVLMPFAAVLLSVRNGQSGLPIRRWQMVGAVMLGCIIGFLVGCPGAILNWSKFTADLLFEMQKSREGMGLLFAGTGLGWVYHYTVSLRHGLGQQLLTLVTAGFLGSLLRRDRDTLVILAFLVPYYVLMGAAQVRFARYMLPLLPPLFLLSSMTLCRLVSLRRASAAGLALFLGGFLPALHSSIAYSMQMSRQDARDAAADFIRRRAPHGASIAFATVPWYWSPPLLPEFTAPLPGQVRRKLILAAASEYILRLPSEGREWDTGVLVGNEPCMVVISDLEAQDAMRLRVPESLRFLAVAEQGRARISFGLRPSFLGLPGATNGYLPNDLLYVCPRVTLYVPKPWLRH